MSTLECAIAIAARAHAGQKDKAGEPYILHPLRVMLSLKNQDQQIVGVLHDVLEDTDVSAESLRSEGFSEEILTALESVTRRNGENYQASVLRAASNEIGREVKLADLKDNMDLARIPNPKLEDYQRIEKYREAIALLEERSS